jgi:TFIIF-interacting CTD phosphatase-like protein
MTDKRIHIILDLDQTIISAEPVGDVDMRTHKKKADKFTNYNMDNYFYVFERPYLQPFLDEIFKKYKVSVFTAASKDYCLFIVDKIILQDKPNRKLQYVFFDHHCKLAKKKYGGTKNLKLLWDDFRLPEFDRVGTVILDDYDKVKNTNSKKCIHVPGFFFLNDESTSDSYLPTLLEKLEKLQIKYSKLKNINSKQV